MHRQLDTKAELELWNKILHSNGIYSAETPTTITWSHIFNAHFPSAYAVGNFKLKQVHDTCKHR